MYQYVFSLTYSIFRNVEEIPEGWFLSFDDHPALKKVKIDAWGNKRNELRALKIKQLEEYLFFYLDSEFTCDDWKLFTTNNPNIKSLTTDGPKLNTESLKYIVTNLVELEEYKHIYFQFLEHADLRLILKNCRNIKKIDVVLIEESGIHYILEEFAEELKNIKLNVKFVNKYSLRLFNH